MTFKICCSTFFSSIFHSFCIFFTEFFFFHFSFVSREYVIVCGVIFMILVLKSFVR